MRWFLRHKLHIFALFCAIGVGLLEYSRRASYRYASTPPDPGPFNSQGDPIVSRTWMIRTPTSDAKVNEGRWLDMFRGRDVSSDGSYHSGWTWWKSHSSDHNIMVRGVGGSLRISLHFMINTYAKPRYTRATKSQTQLPAVGFRSHGFGAQIYNYVDFRGFKERLSVYASYRVYVLTLPMWFIMVALSIPPLYVFVFKPIRTMRRRRANNCINCNYNLNALTEPRCPECGTPVPSKLTLE